MLRPIAQRALALVSTVLATLAIVVAAAPSAAAYKPGPNDLYTPTNLGSCNKQPCVLYPKSAQLPSGRIVATFEDSEGAVVGQRMPIFKSDDSGGTWQRLTDLPAPAYLSSDSRYAPYTSAWTNPYLYVLPQAVGGLAAGTLLLASVVSGADSAPNPNGNGNRQNLAIALQSSTDGGATWRMVNLIATSANQAYDPIWEPYLMVYNNQLVAYYSDENEYSSFNATTGVPTLASNNSSLPDPGTQVLLHRTWNGSSTSSWSAPVIDVSGLTTAIGGGQNGLGGGRPGMTNVVPTTDGKWLMTFEYFGGGLNTRYKIADNPLQFFKVGGAGGTGVDALGVNSGSRPLSDGGSPTLLRRPDGAIVFNAAGSGDVWVDESGSSTGTWKQYQTALPGGYSRTLQWVAGTGQVLILRGNFGGDPILYGHVDLGRSAGTYYSIVNRRTGQLLSTDADKTQDANLTGDRPDILTWTDNPSNDTQRWHVVAKGNQSTFLNKSGGRALAIWLGGANQGAQLAQWVDDNAADKRWAMVPTSDGYFKIQASANSALVATAPAGGYGAVTLQPARAAGPDPVDDTQEWRLVAQ